MALSLIPSLLCSFFLDLAQKIIVENAMVDDQFVNYFLKPSHILARHSSVVHIQKVFDESIVERRI